MLTDIHTHHFPPIGQRAIYNIRIDEYNFEFVRQKNLYYSAGIHPWDIEKANEDWLEKLYNTLLDKDVIAVGECGLDKNIETDYEHQAQLFLYHIQLSEELLKPLIIHCVGYFNELIELRKKLNPSQDWIVHGFRGKPQLAEQLLKAGFYLSFGEKFNPESVRICPLNRLLIETDESQLPLLTIYQNITQIKDFTINE